MHENSEGNPSFRKEIKITVREKKMADVQFVFPGYNMSSRVHKPENRPKRKYFSSPYRCINDSSGNISISNPEKLSNRKELDTVDPVDETFESFEDNPCTVAMDKQGVRYKTMPGKLMALPPIEDLKILKRPVIKVKVSVEKKHGKFKPIPVVDDGQPQLTEPKYRLTKLEHITAPAPNCQKLMVPKALKHPAKMRAVHIPYQRSNDNIDPKLPEQNGHSKSSTDLSGNGNRRKSVRFAPDTLGIEREKYAKTPPPKQGILDEENHNFSNNNADIQIQLPDIKLDSGDKKTHKTVKSVLAKFPRVAPLKYSDCDQPESPYRGVTKRKGSITQITFLSHGEIITPQNSPRVARSQVQGHKRVKATLVDSPPTWQDNVDFEDYLKQKYPHILNAVRTNPALLDMGKPAANVVNLKAKQKMIQNFYHKPAQTNTTPISPDGYELSCN